MKILLFRAVSALLKCSGEYGEASLLSMRMGVPKTFMLLWLGAESFMGSEIIMIINANPFLKTRPSKPTLKNSVSYLNHLSILSLLPWFRPDLRSDLSSPALVPGECLGPQFRSFYYSLCLQFSNLILTAHLLRIYSRHLEFSYPFHSFVIPFLDSLPSRI